MQKVAQPPNPVNWKPKPAATAVATATGSTPTAPPNFRRKRRHSEPHLQATKPYKNFVTHWKLETKKPATPPTRTSAPSSPTPEQHAHNPPAPSANGNWSPSADSKKSVFHPYKKEHTNSPGSSNTRPTPPPGASVRWVRRSSLPQLYDANNAAPFLSELARTAIMEEPEAPEINFPPSEHEYKFPPITLNFPPAQDDILLGRSKEHLAPFLAGNGRRNSADRALPSLQSLLQDVSLSDRYDEPSYKNNEPQERDSIQPPRSYVVRRRMSIDNLLE